MIEGVVVERGGEGRRKEGGRAMKGEGAKRETITEVEEEEGKEEEEETMEEGERDMEERTVEVVMKGEVVVGSGMKGEGGEVVVVGGGMKGEGGEKMIKKISSKFLFVIILRRDQATPSI